MADNPDYKPVSNKAAQTARSGRAIFFQIIRNAPPTGEVDRSHRQAAGAHGLCRSAYDTTVRVG